MLFRSQMICRPLREDTRHAAAAVVGMRNAYRFFQAEVVLQNTLKLGLSEGEGLYNRHRQQGEPRALVQTPRPSANALRRWCCCMTTLMHSWGFALREGVFAEVLLYAVRKARPQRPSQSKRDFPTAEPRSLSAMSGTCCTVATASPPPSASVRSTPPAANIEGRRLSSPPRVLLSLRPRTSGSA